MARVSKKKDAERINSTGQKVKDRQKEQNTLKRLNVVVDEAGEKEETRLSPREKQNSPNQATISHFFCPLETDKKKRKATSSAGTNNSKLSSKGKIALRKFKPKKSKAKQLEEIQKYNKKIPMFFDYVNPERVKEIETDEFRNKHGKIQTKSTRSSKKNNDEFLRNQRQLTEFYEVIEKISELSFSNIHESLRSMHNIFVYFKFN